MRIFNTKSKMDKRINRRKSYSGHILFVATNGFNDGRLKDISCSGLFINSKAHLSVGDIIIMVLPFLKGKKVKCKGQVMWFTKEGFEIELFRNRNLEM